MYVKRMGPTFPGAFERSTVKESAAKPRPSKVVEANELSARRLIGGGSTALKVGRSVPQGELEGQLVAPGVRMRALETPSRGAPSDKPDEIPRAEPSRAQRDDLFPNRGDVVPPHRYEAVEGPALVRAIRERGQMTEQLGYRPAREAMFRDIDNVEGVVEGVYTARKVRTEGIPSAQGKNGMNTEHAWPQSKGVRGTPAKFDLHHLFPSNAYANGRRGNHPFGKVTHHVRWEENGSKLGFDDTGRLVFEPRDQMKGDVARALFYISTVYDLELPEHEEKTLRGWHDADPPDATETLRNEQISRYQGNRNPFVDQPELVSKIERFG